MTTRRRSPAAPVQPVAARAVTRPRPRKVTAGDTPPRLTAVAIEQYAVGEAIDGAQEAKIAAVRDILNKIPGGRPQRNAGRVRGDPGRGVA